MSTRELAEATHQHLPRSNDGTARHVKVGPTGEFVTTAEDGKLITLKKLNAQRAKAREERAERRRRREMRRQSLADAVTTAAEDLTRTKRELAMAAQATRHAARLQSDKQRQHAYNLRTRQHKQHHARQPLSDIEEDDTQHDNQDEHTSSSTDEEADFQLAARQPNHVCSTDDSSSEGIFAGMQIINYDFTQRR